MSVETFSKGLVEIIASSDDSERVENEILQVFKSLSDSSEALDVFRNFGKRRLSFYKVLHVFIRFSKNIHKNQCFYNFFYPP